MGYLKYTKQYLIGGLVLFFYGCSAAYTFHEACQDTFLQRKLCTVIDDLGLQSAVKERRFSVALTDITDISSPKFAAINGNVMMYAASLPKIAILFGLLKRVEEGTLNLDERLNTLAEQMVRESSNPAATELFYTVEPAYIAKLLTSPKYRFYNRFYGGGLWVGKEYGKRAAWQRDPIRDLSHAASAIQVSRLYYLLESGSLLSPPLAQKMKEILANSALHHKFLKGLAESEPSAVIYRKSGGWRTFHSDSAIVEHDGRKYIAVALANDRNGSLWLEKLIVQLDHIISSYYKGRFPFAA